MLPGNLKAADFAAYPALGRELAVRNLATLQQLPPALAPLLLREILSYDWKFPAERADLERQFSFLAPLSTTDLQRTIAAFAALQLTPEIQNSDWINQPATFSEKMTAHLWATHQIEAFRAAAVGLVAAVNAGLPEQPAELPRIGIVLIGQGVSKSDSPLFRKLRPFGTYFTNVDGSDGYPTILGAVRKRALAHAKPYGHWHIDGGTTEPQAGVTSISYESIRPLRSAMQARLQAAWASNMGSEALRTLLAQLQPKEFGLQGDPVLDRFQLSLLSEGSGTQVYSTTFAQWAAREALRRAQPHTLLLRFAPRQRERPMSEMLAEGRQPAPLDPEGSLRDADLGAYYTWLNQQRLTGSQHAAFLVWFEGHSEAVMISPNTERGRTSAEPVKIASLVAQIGLT